MTNETTNKPTKVTKTIKVSTKKSILIKFALIQFFGLVLLAVALITVAILFTKNKAEAATESEAGTKPEVQYVEVEKPIEKIVEKEVEVKIVDQEAVDNLANEKAKEIANQMFEEYKTEYVEAQEAAAIANLSTIYIHVYGGNGESNSFYLAIEGSLHEELKYNMIEEVLKADARFDGYKVKGILNKDAVEVFVGRDYTSTREIRIALK